MTNRMEQAQRRRLIEVDRRAKARAEENAVEAGLTESQALGEARGGEYQREPQRRGEARKPIRRITGLEWLHRKGKVSDDQFAAGKRYGDAYRKALGEQSIKSILNPDIGGGAGQTVEQILERATAAARAKQKLVMYRNQLMGEATIINAVDQVCGLEQTPREAAQNGRDASAIEALVVAGLGLLILHLAPPSRETGGDPQGLGQEAA